MKAIDLKRILSRLLSYLLIIGMLPQILLSAHAITNVWNGTADTAWYDSANPQSSYTISTAEELAGLASLVNGGTNFSGVTITLGSNIALNDTANWTSWSGSNAPTNVWMPIGNNAAPFAGTFDGGGYTVSGLYLNAPSTMSQGLFGFVQNATIQNVGVVNSYMLGKKYIGGVVGYCFHTTIDSCYNSGTVVGTSTFIGGVLGANDSNTNTTTIINCYNTGSVSSTYSGADANVGGIAGRSTHMTQYCYNTGNISGYSAIGGIVGTTAGTIERCYNIGTVVSSASAGNAYAGGISGYVGNFTSIQNCYNAGNISGSASFIGGIGGKFSTSAMASYCYNSGSVCGSDYDVGAIAGYATAAPVYCYYDKQIAGSSRGTQSSDSAGSCEGKLTSEMTSGTPFDGWSGISGEHNVWNFTAAHYPRLTGYIDASTDYHMDETEAASVSASPLFLAETSSTDYEKASSVKSNFRVSAKDAIYWDSSDTSVISLDFSTVAVDEMGIGQINSSGTATLSAQLSPSMSKKVTLTCPSTNAALASVLSQTDTAPGGGTGNSASDPITWSISVGNAVSSVSGGNLVASDSNASAMPFSDAAFSHYVETGLALSLDTPTTLYVKVRAEDLQTMKYYTVTITRSASVNYDTSWYDAGESAFTLSTEQQLRGLAGIVNGTAYPTDSSSNVTDTTSAIAADYFAGKTITLANDVSLSAEDWIPIGTTMNGFQGTFDGGQHTVSGMQISRISTMPAFCGLFGYGNTASIQDLTVNGAIAFDDTTVQGAVGGLVGYTNGCSISNCKTNVTMQITADRSYVGGIVGMNISSTIANCGAQVAANVTAGNPQVGGIVGMTTASMASCIYNSYAHGTITVDDDGTDGFVGGIAGVLNNDTAVNNYFAGTITKNGSGDTKTGDIFGTLCVTSDMTLSNNFYDSTHTAVGYAEDTLSNEITDVSAYVTGISAEDMTDDAGLLAALNTGRTAVDALLAAEGSSLTARQWNLESSLNDGYPQFEAAPAPEDTSGGNTSGGTAASSSSSSSHHSSSSTATTAANTVPVQVDGKSYNIGTASTKTDAATGMTTAVVTVDAASFNQKLTQASESVVITVPSDADATASQSILTAQMVENAAKKNLTVAVQTENVRYIIPANAVDVDAAVQALGLGTADLDNIEMQINISHVNDTAANFVENAAADGGYTLVMSPVEFTIQAVSNGNSVEIAAFKNYVTRSIAIPSTVSPTAITTAVVVDADGTERHVPTEVYQAEDGQYYARIHSLTNSVYALIDHEVSFADAQGTWYDDVASELASRMILNGREDGTFDGTANITRAEFAATLIRALGLPADGSCDFYDVSNTAWCYGAVGKAAAYGLIDGYDDGSFAPNAAITRQEAMVMLQRAAEVADFTGQESTVTQLSSAFTDTAQVSSWAQNAVAFTVSNGLIVGSDGALRPQATITRAECAAAVLRFLQNAALVDVRIQI